MRREEKQIVDRERKLSGFNDERLRHICLHGTKMMSARDDTFFLPPVSNRPAAVASVRQPKARTFEPLNKWRQASGTG